MESAMEDEDNAVAERQELLNECSCSTNNGPPQQHCTCEARNVVLMSKKTSPEKYGNGYPDESLEEDPISKCIGEYGRWQLLLTFLLSLFSFPCTFHIFSPTFTAAARNFWCSRPSHLSSLSVKQWQIYSQSQDNCKILNLDWSMINATAIQNNQDIPDNTAFVDCTSWEWETNAITSTIISEWNLVCDRNYLNTIAEMIFLAGVALGGIITGFISDRFGRKKTLMASLVSQSTIGIAIYFCQNFKIYVALRLLLGFSCVSVVNAGFVLSVELVGGKWRTVAGICNFFPLPVAYMIVSATSMALPDWRHLQLALTLPGLLLISLWWILPESPRWLLSMGKIDDLKVVLEKASTFNKRQLPSNMDKILMPQGESNHERKVGIPDLFKSKMLKITSVVLFAWFTSTVTYYGLVLNIGSFGGDLYTTSILSGLVELPGIALAIPMLLKLGRRYPISMTMVGAGLACLASMLVVDKSLLWLKITFIMIGKFTAGAINAVLPMYTAELFPTLLRNLGVGAGQVSAGIGLVLIPYVWDSVLISERLPMSLVATLGICGGLSVLLLPETANRPLSDDIIDTSEKKPVSNGISEHRTEGPISIIGT